MPAMFYLREIRKHIFYHNRKSLIQLSNSTFFRYAIGYAERSGPKAHIGWLASLANATDQPYTANNTGGPSIKVGDFRPSKRILSLIFERYWIF